MAVAVFDPWTSTLPPRLAAVVEWVDRYTALGIDRPDPATVCKGPCEGTGMYPRKVSDVGNTDVDYIFSTCPDCHGSGRRR
jgi:hypothetical protein